MNEEFEKWARDKGYPFCEVVPAYGPASAMSTTEIRYSEMAGVAWQASRKQAEWQPIKTAPKDGSHMLLMATQHQMLYQKPEMIVGYWASGWWSNGGHTLSHVTHWMPLPQPPAVQKE